MKTKDQQKLQRKRQLTIQYMLAVALIFLVSLSSLLVLQHILKKQEGYATVINMSGRQCMLSQQIALLAHEIVGSHQEKVREELIEKIDLAIHLMKKSHQHLISGKAEDNTGVELSYKLSRMYFHPPLEVDRLVREYLAAINTLITEPVTEKSLGELSALSIVARGVLLNSLNTVVQQYEEESIRYSEILKESAIAIFLLMVLLLVVIIIFGFRPMANVVAENESMLNSILDSIPILMDIVNKDGIILYQSKFLLNSLGEATIGQRCFEAYKIDQIRCESCPTGRVTLNPDMKVSTCFDRLGTGTIVEITHLPIFFKGEEALLHTFHDITEQKKTETFLVRAKEEADHASALKSDFLANMSHEIRTPMNAIIGFSDLALETELTLQQQDYLKKINRSSYSLLEIIDEILDFSKIEAGKLDLGNKKFCLGECLKDLTLLFGDKAEGKNIALRIHQHADIPVQLVGDALRLKQILVNLIGNSLKFTDQGEITVQVILEDCTDQRARLAFSVADTGIGISSDKMAILFDSFSQADSSITRKYGGTGLGLAISKQLVELLGGTLEVSSKEGVGAVFSFTVAFELPAVERGDQFHLSEESSGLHSLINRAQENNFNKEEAMARIGGAHVLLVEDNPINQQVAEEILAKADIILDTVGNGKQALEKIIATKAGYDAILMDIQMPVMGGIECTRELRQREERSGTGHVRIPIIAMTANAMQGDREQYLQAGMDDYVAKPISREELFRVLVRWIPGKKHFAIRQGHEKRQKKARRKGLSDRRQYIDVSSLPDKLSGIDLKQGLARVEGNSGLYIRLLNEFATEYASMGQEILEALHKQDQECAERLVHTVKGMAGSLGALDLAAASLVLEQAIKEGHEVNTQMTQFEEALQQVIHSLGTLKDSQQNVEPISEKNDPVDKERIAALMTELKDLLAGKNFQANSKWQEVRPLLDGVESAILSQIDHSLGMFDYTTALELLAEMNESGENAK